MASVGWFHLCAVVASALGTCAPPEFRAVSDPVVLDDPPPAAVPARPCVYGTPTGGPSYSVRDYFNLGRDATVVGQRVRVHGRIHVEFEDNALYDDDGDGAISDDTAILVLTAAQHAALDRCTRERVVVDGTAGRWVVDSKKNLRRSIIYDIRSVQRDAP